MQSASLSPAYGRDYKSKDAMLADWESGKDFLIYSFFSHCYCSIRDLPAMADNGITSLHFHYANDRRTFVLAVGIPA